MDEKWKQTFLDWRKTTQFKKSLQEAENIISEALKKHRPYLAYSGGKDSLCLVHLVCRQNPHIFVYHHSQGKYMPKEIQREIEDNAVKAGAKNLHVYPPERNFWTSILEELKRYGYNAVFVGLRKEESSSRKLRINKKKSLTCFFEYWPLANWTWMDVWAYIVGNNLPYPSVYDKYAKVEGWDRVRFHSFFDPSMDKFGCTNVDGVLNWRYRGLI